MLPRQQPDRIHVAFDDHRLVANAGLLLPVTLADRGMARFQYEPPPPLGLGRTGGPPR